MTFYSNVESITTQGANGADLWTFIICCLLVITAILFYLFYLNRVMARVLSIVANQYLWKRCGVYIQLDSIQLSLLGARILFKNFQYHSTDLSFSVVKGHITLQYWFFNIQQTNSFSKDDIKLPCRLVCSIEGFEGFIYNNIPLYERMKAILGLETELTPPQRPKAPFAMKGDTPNVHDPEKQSSSESTLLQRLLPIQVECTTAAIVIGNSQLPCYIVMKASQASGTLSTGQPRSPLDHFKVKMDLVVRKGQVNMEPNENNSNEECWHNERVRPQRYTFSWWDDVYQWIRWAFFLGPTLRSVKDSHHEEQQQQHPSCQPSYREDYAKIENIVECSQVVLCYYADIPGPVPSVGANGYSGIDSDIGNGGLPPEWGVRFSLWNAVINYGPWADKQRLALQHYFFPNPYRTSKPTTRLLPGETRIPTSFEIMVDFMTEARVKVPTKEVSKNWKFTGDMSDLDTDKDGYYLRPYGWFDVKFKEGSSLKSVTPLVTDDNGCISTVDIELKEVDATTSVNFANVVCVDGAKIHIDMPYPLIWNEHRAWTVDVKASNPVAFLLRDHLYLLQDLVKEWIALPPVDLLHFVPVTYQLRVETTTKSIIFLYLNEHNIISYPNSIDDNTLAKIHVHKILLTFSVPVVTYQPEVVSVNYGIQLDNVYGGVTFPSCHTWNSFLRSEDTELGSCKVISINGFYEAYTTVDVLRHIESTNIHIKFEGAVLKIFGSVLRFIIVFRDNYIGNSVHFCTIDEYRQRLTNPEGYAKMRKKEMDARNLSDPFELYVLCDVDDCALILPENLYECSHYSQLEFRELQIEVRSLDIYLDMYLTVSPITWTRESNPNPVTRYRHSRMKTARDPGNYLYIDGVNIYTHRLFGPLPAAPTYLCHWDFDAGNVKGELKPSFLMGFLNFAQTLVYNFIDEDNAIPLDLATQTLNPDVTFATAQVGKVDVYLMTQNSSTQLQLQNGFRLDFGNLINEKHNQRVGFQLPNIAVTCLANQEQDDQQQNQEHTWVEVARIQSGISVTFYRHTKDWQQNRTAQQNFIRLQDQITQRCTYLYEDGGTRKSATTVNDHHVGVLYAPVFRLQTAPTHSGTNNEQHSISLERPILGDRRPVTLGDEDEDGCSMISFNDQWLVSGSINSEIDHLRLNTGTDSIESMVSNMDSFCTADQEGGLYVSENLSNVEETSIDTPSEIGDEDNYDYDYNGVDTLENTDQSGYTATSIPPSIPYSGYLNRFAVKRATQLVGKGQTFFHPYIPPPKPSFIPQKAKFSQQDWKCSTGGGDFFAGFQDDAGTNLSTDMEHEYSDDKRNDVLSTLVLEATQPVKVLVTPILIKVVQEVTEIINKDDWDLETMLDCSQMEYVGQLTRYLTDKFISIRLAVWLPSARLHFIQNVMIPGDLPSYKHTQHHLQTLYDNENDMLCAADIFLDNFQVIGGLTFQDYAFGLKQKSVAESNLVLEESRLHVNIGNMGIKVQYISDCYENRRHVMFGIPTSRQYVHGWCDSDSSRSLIEQQPANELVVFDLELKKLCFKWRGAKKPNYLDFGVDELSVIIITESIEILLGAAYLWLVFVGDLQCIIERFQDRRSRQNQVFIHELSKFSNDGTKISCDPQFLTVPTNLGLRIGSKNFRCDVGWKLLARMRQCLRLMPSTEREKLQYRLTSGGAIEHVNPTALYQQVIQAFTGWRSWEIHTREIQSCRLFTNIFNQHKNLQQKNEDFGLANSGDCGDDDDDDDASSDLKNLSENTAIGFTDNLATYLMASINHARFNVNQFDFCIYEEEPDADDNHVIVGPLEFAIDTTYKLSEFANSASDLAEGYLDAVAKLDIGAIEVSVNPTVLAFARHMLTVQWVFTNKLKNLSRSTSTQCRQGTSTFCVDQSPAPTTSTTTSTQGRQLSFDISLLLSKIDVVAHALVRIHQIQLNAWAQKLAMKNNIHALRGSMVFSNPKLSSVVQQHSRSEKDTDINTSSKANSNRPSRKQNSQSGRVIMIVSGGIDSFDTGFHELVSWGHRWNSATTNDTSSYGTTRQDSKRIHTKLLALTIYDAKLNASIYQPSKSRKKQKPAMKTSNTREVLKIFASIGGFNLDAPQSLLRLYSFIEEWQREQGQRYHFMFENLLNEWEEQRRLNDQGALSNQTCVELSHHDIGQGLSSSLGLWYDVKLQLLLTKFVVKADLLRSLSIKFSIDDLLVLVDGTQQQTISSAPVINYALQLSKQAVEFITHTKNNINIIDHLQPSNLENISAFNLPGIRSSGTLVELSSGKYGYHLQSSISVDFIAISLDVSIIDSLLTAHSLLGNEINELIETLSYSRKNCHQLPDSPSSTTPPPSAVFKYVIGFSLDGLQIKAASPTANGLFESSVLEALISNHSPSAPNDQFLWKISGNNLALSLSHVGSSVISLRSNNVLEDGKRLDRLAYIVIDFGFQNQPIRETTSIVDQHLDSYNIIISKVQGVMQPIALGKLAEMYIYYDLELKKKKEIKREEIEQLAANTKRIVESFQADTTISEHDIHTILQGKHLSLIVENLGAAIPLTDLIETPLSLPVTARMGKNLNDQQQQQRQQYHSHHHHQQQQHAALLFTFSSLQFTTKKCTTTTATIENTSLQFVKRFDQSNELHFLARNHQRMNQIHLPSIKCIVTTEIESQSRKLNVNIDANLRGIEGELDGTIIDYLNRLAVIYYQGIDRVNSFIWETNGGVATDNNTTAMETTLASSLGSELTYLDVKGLFKFGASVVRLYPRCQINHYGRKQEKATTRRSTRGHGVGTTNDNGRDLNDEFGIATIKLPGIDAEFKYTTPLGALANLSVSPHLLHTDIFIRESNNILHPSLVQFLGEVASGLNFGMQLSTEKKIGEPASPRKNNPCKIGASIVLRLSKTKLDLSCQPTSKVICSLGWSASEFVLNSFSDGSARKTGCSGFLRNISTVVKHHFSPQSCLAAGMDLVLFNITLTPERGGTHVCNNISVIVKIPSLHGDVSMRHLQDLLILGSTWFVYSHYQTQWRHQQQQQQQQQTTEQEYYGTTHFASYLTLVLDKATFSVDMGQAIGKVKVIPRNLALQAHMVPAVSLGVDLSLDDTSIVSEGRFTGEAKIYQIVLHGRFNTSSLGQAFYSQLYLGIDGLQAKFTYEYQNILELLQEPIQVTATIISNNNNDNNSLEQGNSDLQHQLELLIHFGRTIATLSVKTLPVIIVMHRRFMELLERKQNEANTVCSSWRDSTIGVVNDSVSTQSLLAISPPTLPNVSTTISSDRHLHHQYTPPSKMEIFSESVQLIVYPSQFQDGDNVEIRLMQMKGLLQQTPKAVNKGTHRHLLLSIEKANLLKNVPGQEIMQIRQQQLDGILPTKMKSAMGDNDNSIDMDETMKRNESRMLVLKEMGTSIFMLPATKLVMDSTQVMRSVEHIFAVDFRDRVQLSLNIGQLKCLQDLVSAFIDQMDRAMKSVDSSSILRTSDNEEQHQEEDSLGNDAASLDSGIGVGELAIGQQQQQHQLALSNCTTAMDNNTSAIKKSTDQLTYTTDRPIRFNPQIRQMGDATPPVEWFLGLKRHRIPELVHENVTLQVDQMMQVIWDVCQNHAHSHRN